MPAISSMANTRIKHIRALQTRKAREQSGTFWVEGIRNVTQAVELGAQVETLVVAPGLLSSRPAHELVERQVGRGTAYVEVTPGVFESIASKYAHQGLGAVVRQRWEALQSLRLSGGLCWVALDAIQDPGNLGTILRTCDAVGAEGIILLGPTTDPYDPLAVRASMGAIFSQRLVRTTFSEFAA